MTKKQRKIIIDTDWWTDCDDVAAVAMACRLMKRGVWSISGIILNACMEYSAASLDGLLRSELSAEHGVRIGIDADGTDFGGSPPYQKRMAEKCGSRMKNSDCESSVRVYRKLLADSADGETDIIEIGYEQVLAGLLRSPADDISPLDGRELMRRKVGTLWVMGGLWAEGRENNFARNIRASRAAAELWNAKDGYDGRTVFLGYEVGESVITAPRPNDEILYGAFHDYNLSVVRPSWDPLTVLLAAAADGASDAAIQKAGYEAVHGAAYVSQDGSNTFMESPDGKHIFVRKTMPDAWYEKKINEALYV